MCALPAGHRALWWHQRETSCREVSPMRHCLLLHLIRQCNAPCNHVPNHAGGFCWMTCVNKCSTAVTACMPAGEVCLQRSAGSVVHFGKALCKKQITALFPYLKKMQQGRSTPGVVEHSSVQQHLACMAPEWCSEFNVHASASPYYLLLVVVVEDDPYCMPANHGASQAWRGNSSALHTTAKQTGSSCSSCVGEEHDCNSAKAILLDVLQVDEHNSRGCAVWPKRCSGCCI